MKKRPVLNYLFLGLAALSFMTFFFGDDARFLLLVFAFLLGASVTSGQNSDYWRWPPLQRNTKTTIEISDGLTLILAQNETKKYAPVIRKARKIYARSGVFDSKRIILPWGPTKTARVLDLALAGSTNKIDGVIIWASDDWVNFEDNSHFSLKSDDLAKVRDALVEHGWLQET